MAKMLTTEQQTDLRTLLEGIKGLDAATQAQVVYWSLELKPKRIRTPKAKVAENNQQN